MTRSVVYQFVERSLPPNPSLPPDSQPFSLRPSLFSTFRHLPASLRPSSVDSIRPSLIPKLRARAPSPWVLVGMALAVIPLAISVLVAQSLFSRQVVSAYDEAATRFQDHVVPAHELELAVWEAQARANEYVSTRDPKQLVAYHMTRSLIRAKFSSLRHYAQSREEDDSLERAGFEWDRADDLIEAGFGPQPRREAETADSSNEEISTTVSMLREVEASLADDMRARHLTIASANERAKSVALIAMIASAMVFLGGAFMIWRSRAAIGRVARVLKRQSDRASRIAQQSIIRVA